MPIARMEKNKVIFCFKKCPVGSVMKLWQPRPASKRFRRVSYVITFFDRAKIRMKAKTGSPTSPKYWSAQHILKAECGETKTRVRRDEKRRLFPLYYDWSQVRTTTMYLYSLACYNLLDGGLRSQAVNCRAARWHKVNPAKREIFGEQITFGDQSSYHLASLFSPVRPRSVFVKIWSPPNIW